MVIKYFDNAATTRVSDEVFNEMYPYFSNIYFNASSIYDGGKFAKEGIELARRRVAAAINAKPEEIYFTSGGSESDNLALKGTAFSLRGRGHIITTKIEHPAILNTARSLEKIGHRVTYLNVKQNGIIDLNELLRNIRRDTYLISVMSANNEIGTIQPLEEIGKIARRYNILFHTDAVQAIGNMKIDVNKYNIDLLSMSGHKFYGPKGVGALYVREGINFVRQIDGGHQERDKRAGTENTPGIVGLGKAIEIANKNLDLNISRLITLREYYFRKIEENFRNYRINGDRKLRLPGNTNVSFRGMNGNYIVSKLAEKGIYTSSMSACSSGYFNPSHVLLAIGLSKDDAMSSLRVTFGKDNTIDEINELIENLKLIFK